MYGRILLSVPAVMQLIGPFYADFSHTHVFNPNWPPHAKFHNGQTMSMGACLCFITLYYTFRPTVDVVQEKDSLFTAALMASLYWGTGVSAILYPGSKGMDPEFGEGFPQAPLFIGLGVLGWVGYGIECWRLA
ncbi:hypothetical protein GLAREA_01156 [Glarea lozoyensis ATCC 20868]|uniref:Uncharacterized protein n=2 Tax=Glarea lozoyensis TaxID=101852 RepID=S3DDC8_GLAL2|nr:uncharacterized protein GLAREA_01156 [Glarea lozoyensis ATCC 20868]EPE29996.1 hypothetical protein GLAREA_01156 [Glarea lozoyensis ATCC 20868]